MRISPLACLFLIGAPLPSTGDGTCSVLGESAKGACPFMQAHKHNEGRRLQFALTGSPGDGGVVPPGGFEAVKEDIRLALVDSKEFFPADFGNYGPLIIRLAWHCNGSYRRSDGRGGCDGGRIRFDPEISWPDNGNLDNALLILEPIKVKYGSDLSWGDLIVLAGNTAIESMGFPSLPFCGGRVDDGDGNASEALGPTPLQEAVAPCETQGLCEFPLGPTTLGLIYVNPAGPLGDFNDILGSANDIRNSFGNMGFNDSETVSLVGGGHAFGKTHGACSDPPCTGLAPDGNPAVLTSGFEGAWTVEPTVWSNEYFNNLLMYNFTSSQSPAGQPQWLPVNPSTGAPGPDFMMLTADLALQEDPAYRTYVETYAADQAALEKDFAASWYRLTSQDMGPADRCIGDLVPSSPRSFQQPLPPPPRTREEDFMFARFAIQAAIDDGTFKVDELVRLAFQCASTYRATDFKGGCNGARIRFPPESTWSVNTGLDTLLATFESTISFRTVSFSDMIVLAGYSALEAAGGKTMDFCGGRSDATDAAFSELLAPRDYIASPVVAVRDNFAVMGLSAAQGVALMGRPTSRFPELGSLYASLTTNDFAAADADGMQTPTTGGGPSVTEMEFALKLDTEYTAIVTSFMNDPVLFKSELASGWVQLMNADRHSGPTTNVCTTSPPTPTSQPVWWPRIDRDFIGTRLKRCARRFDTPPVPGTRCASRPKTCFFGTQTCPNDVGAHPVTRCFCDGADGEQVWTCGGATCPATQFDPIS